MKLKSIDISNFARFDSKTCHIEFPDDEILVLGENQDSPGSNSNGSGKSSFLDAIDWVINGDLVRDISNVDKVIRRGQLSCSVNLKLLTDDKIIYNLSRKRDTKEKLTYEIETPTGIINKTRRLTDQTEQEVFKDFNLDFKRHHFDFCNTVYFSTTAVKGFASKEASNADRIALITRFLSLDPFDEATKRAKELRIEHETEVNKLIIKKSEIENQLPEDFTDYESYNKLLEENKLELLENRTEWVAYRQTLLDQQNKIAIIESINAQIETIKLRQKQYNESIKRKEDLELKKIKYEDSIKSIDETVLQYSTIEEYNSTIKEIQKVSKELLQYNLIQREQLKNIELQLKSPLICPNCNTELSYLENKLIKINSLELNKKKTELIGLNQTTIIQCKEREQEEKKYKETIEGLKQLKNQHSSIEQSIKLISEQLGLIVVNAEDFNNLIIDLQSKIPQDIDVLSIREGLVNADTQITELDGNLANIKTTQDNLLELSNKLRFTNSRIINENAFVSNYHYWETSFPKVKQIIIESYLPIFETRTNYYLDYINSGFTIGLSTEKEKKTGGVKQEFSILVTDEHGSSDEFETFSEGERKRIAVCVGFALREIALSHRALPFDFMMFDEIIDGLDETGISEFFKLLKTIPGQKLIISHNSDLKAMFSSIINVIRKNGTSTAELICLN